MTITILIDGRDYRTMGAALRDLRRAAGLTQEQIAERSHVSRNAIAQCETDMHLPKLETLEALASAVGGDLTILFESGTSDRALAALVRRIDDQERLYKQAVETAQAQAVELDRLRDLLGQRSAKRLDRAVEAVRAVADRKQVEAAIARLNELETNGKGGDQSVDHKE